jgi:hypothetical protein
MEREKEMLYEVEKNQSSAKYKCLICHHYLSSKRNVLMHLHSATTKVSKFLFYILFCSPTQFKITKSFWVVSSKGVNPDGDGGNVSPQFFNEYGNYPPTVCFCTTYDMIQDKIVLERQLWLS